MLLLISLCRNKEKMEVFLRERKLCRTIPGVRLAELETMSCSYPLVAKPFDGRSSQGLRILESRDGSGIPAAHLQRGAETAVSGAAEDRRTCHYCGCGEKSGNRTDILPAETGASAYLKRRGNLCLCIPQ